MKAFAQYLDKSKFDLTVLCDGDNNESENYKVIGVKPKRGWLKPPVFNEKDGKIKHVMDKVKTKTHHEDVLNFIKENL